jgi:hypothetical protein
MAQDQDFDASKAHRYFSADCFNKAWALIEKTERTPAEDEQMIRLSQASLWHWTQRDDCTNENMSIGYWQASRIHATLGRADDARRYGQLCLEIAPNGIAVPSSVCLRGIGAGREYGWKQHDG